MLPGQAGALGRPVVEPETRGSPTQIGERRHFSRRHEALGKSDFQTVEAYGQHSLTPHRDPRGSAYRSDRRALVTPGRPHGAARVRKPYSAAAERPRATPSVACIARDSSSGDGTANRAPVTNFQK